MDIKEKDIISAYNQGSVDVKRVLSTLFPTINFSDKLKVGDKVKIIDYSGNVSTHENGGESCSKKPINGYILKAINIKKLPMQEYSAKLRTNVGESPYNNCILLNMDTFDVSFTKLEYLKRM
jgi:hypothetical protein